MELENTSTIPIKWFEISHSALEAKHKSTLGIKLNDFIKNVPPGAKVIVSGTVYVSTVTDHKEINTPFLLEIRYKGES